MLSRKRHGILDKHSLHQVNSLDHPIDTHAGRIERDAGLLVLLPQPASPDANLKPTLRKHIDRRHRLG